MCYKLQVYRLLAMAFGVGLIVSSFISSVLLRVLIGVCLLVIGLMVCRRN